MRPNPVKRLLREGKSAVGTWLSLGSITAARYLARAGFDYLTVAVEHSLANVEPTTMEAARAITNVNRAYWGMMLRMYGWGRTA